MHPSGCEIGSTASSRKCSLVALLTTQHKSSKEDTNMDPAFILLSLWFLGASVKFLKGND